MNLFSLFKIVKLRHIVFVLISSLMYLLGGGIAYYFGANFGKSNYWLGLIWTLAILCGGFLLVAYFTPIQQFDLEQDHQDWIEKNKVVLLQVAFFFLTISGAVIVILIISNSLSFNLGLILALTIIGLVITTSSQYVLRNVGFQEILYAIYLGSLIPATGFFILIPSYTKVLLFFAFPMTCLALETVIAIDFSTYARDQIINKRTILILLTWQSAIPVHNVLIIASYIFIASGVIIGISPNIVWPALLTLPLACVQIYWLFRISQGKKPIWAFFNTLSASVLGLTAYFITYSFWIK